MLSPHLCIATGFCCTLGAAFCATAALILRPFAAHRATGRQLAYRSVAFGLLSLPLHLYGALGSNIADHVYAVGLTPLVLCVVAVVLYPRQRQTSAQGFEVVSPTATRKDAAPPDKP